MSELTQRRFFTRRDFRIGERKLFYNHSEWGNSNEVDIPFENIDGEKVSFRKANNLLLGASIMVFLVSMSLLYGYITNGNGERFAWLFWLVISVSIFFFYWNSRQSFWKIKLANNSYVYIHKNIPSKETANKFIEDLINSRNDFLLSTYGNIDENLD